MVVSPLIDVVSVLLEHMYFFHLAFCRYLSAMAVNCCWTSAVSVMGEGVTLCVMVMSAPMVAKGQ